MAQILLLGIKVVVETVHVILDLLQKKDLPIWFMVKIKFHSHPFLLCSIKVGKF